MFGQEKFDVENEGRGNGKYISFGNQQLMITGFEVKTSSAGDKKQIHMLVETPTVTTAGFTADEKAVNGGKIGKITATIFMDFNVRSEQTKDFEKKIQTIAKKMGAYDEVCAIKASTIEEYLNKVATVLKGKFAWFQVCAEVYGKNDKGYDKYILKMGRFGYVADSEEGLKPFDKTNKFHYGYSSSYKLVEEADAKSEAPASTEW